MKSYAGVAVLLVMMTGCAAYKELQPDPEIVPVERGYIELKKGKDNFEIKEGKKYFLKVPAPPDDHFYLLIVTPSKRAIYSSFSSAFDNGAGTPIPDEAKSDDSISVFAVDKKVPTFYWVIDTVRSDMMLALRGRYVPVWRYTFENKYSEFQQTLAGNAVDRSTYNSINLDFDVDGIDFEHEIPSVEERTSKIGAMRDELLRLENVFPPNIASSKDTAYEQYVAFKAKVDDELTFQGNYSAVLNLFKKEKDTRGNTAMFLDSASYFTGILMRRDRLPAGIMTKASHVLLRRLSNAFPYLDNEVRLKGDISRFVPVPSVADLSALYRACAELIPGETEAVLRVMSRFNEEVDSLQGAATKFEGLKAYSNVHSGPTTESFCSELASKAAEVRAAIPEPRAGRFARYGTYDCASRLSREILNAANRADDLRSIYETAGTVANQIASRSWASAEQRLRQLYESPGSSNSAEVLPQRTALVKALETDIFNGVKTESDQRVNAFISAHRMEFDKVAQLYADSAFRPVLQLSFSSGGPADLAAKRKQIDEYLDQIKYFRFPETSIKNIYAEFTRNMSDRGVEKARAIVTHGNFYKGTDKQVKGLIAECDVDVAKWIVKPKEYRKLFALPITDNAQGVNDYMFRIALKIPSEAEFPVFDVNIKLPQEIAGKSGSEQWYESITIDKKPIKNEGRFRITSPTVENNYEALITPVQMDKAGRNILEVRFKSRGFRVFEVSVMAQVPIIRKN